jgi:hypothetical protein
MAYMRSKKRKGKEKERKRQAKDTPHYNSSSYFKRIALVICEFYSKSK